MNRSCKWYLLRWVAGWGDMLTGLMCVLTLGFYLPGWNAKTDGWFLSIAEQESFKETP